MKMSVFSAGKDTPVSRQPLLLIGRTDKVPGVFDGCSDPCSRPR